MLIIYFRMDSASINLLNTNAQQNCEINSMASYLLYTPGSNGPFLLNPLTWLFAFMLWASWGGTQTQRE